MFRFCEGKYFERLDLHLRKLVMDIWDSRNHCSRNIPKEIDEVRLLGKVFEDVVEVLRVSVSVSER